MAGRRDEVETGRRRSVTDALFSTLHPLAGLALLVAMVTLVEALLATLAQWIFPSVHPDFPYAPAALLSFAVGSYGLLLAFFEGCYQRRLSPVIERLRVTRIADVQPGAFVAVDGCVVSGEPATEGAVTWPLVIEDGSGVALRIPHRFGSAEGPSGDPMVHFGPPTVRLGDRLFAAGAIERSAGDAVYRASNAEPALVRGDAPLFLVHEGSRADTVEALRRSEPRPGCGLLPIAFLVVALGALAAWRL